MKPITIDLPDWVAWQATDENGAVTLFEHEPFPSRFGRWAAEGGRCVVVSCTDQHACGEWQQTKRQLQHDHGEQERGSQ